MKRVNVIQLLLIVAAVCLFFLAPFAAADDEPKNCDQMCDQFVQMCTKHCIKAATDESKKRGRSPALAIKKCKQNCKKARKNCVDECNKGD